MEKLTGMNLLEEVMAFPSTRTREFKRSHPRVSSIGNCELYQVAVCQGVIEPTPFHAFYSRMGIQVQHLVADDFRERGCTVYEDLDSKPLSVWTGLVDEEGHRLLCHPDLWLKTPSGETAGVQVKSCDQTALDKMEKPRKSAVDQARSEWAFWVRYGAEYEGQKVEAPQRYFVLCASRESAALNQKSFEIDWSVNKARVLVQRFYGIEAHRKAGTLPSRPFSRPTMECHWSAGSRGEHWCPRYSACWGDNR